MLLCLLGAKTQKEVLFNPSEEDKDVEGQRKQKRGGYAMLRKFLLIGVLAGLFATPMMASAKWVVVQGKRTVDSQEIHFGFYKLYAVIDIYKVWYNDDPNAEEVWKTDMLINATGGACNDCAYFSNHCHNSFNKDWWGKRMTFVFKGKGFGSWIAFGAKAVAPNGVKALVIKEFGDRP